MKHIFPTLLVVAIAAAGCRQADASGAAAADDHASAPAASAVSDPASVLDAAATLHADGTPVMTVYATPTCGCCKAWIAHMQENGYAVEVVYQNDLSGVRAQHQVPGEVTGCHMGVVDGYVVEGHVPADVITRLLRERPAVTGIAVPGMPAGSPGMEMPNGLVQPYEVYTFDASGPRAVYEFRN